MKYLIFLILIFFSLPIFCQSTYPIRADTVYMYSGSTAPGAGAELLLQNGSRTVVNGLLTNINGRGNTQFRNLVLTNNGSTVTGSILGITGQGTIALPWLKPYVDTIYFSAGLLHYVKNGNTYDLTLPVAPVYTAGNLLTKTGGDVFELGGTATRATTLTLAANPYQISANQGVNGTAVFNMNNLSVAGIQLSATIGNLSTSVSTSGNSVEAITGDNVNLTQSRVFGNGSQQLISVSSNVGVGQKTSQLLLGQSFNQFSDGINSVGLSYALNYASNNGVNDRWLTDKRYVDSTIAANAYLAGELLTLNGHVFSLGGTATQNDTLKMERNEFHITAFDDGAGTTDFSVAGGLAATSQMYSSDAVGDQFAYIRNSNGLNDISAQDDINHKVTHSTIDAGRAIIQVRTNTSTTNTTTTFEMGETRNVFTDGIHVSGISYGDNYAANNTSNPRWLTDKRYVDSLMAYIPLKNYYADTANTSATPGTYTVLYQFTIPANRLSGVGQSITARYGGTYAANSNEKGLEMMINGTVVGANSLIPVGPGFQVNVTMVRTGASTARVSYQADAYSQDVDLSGINFSAGFRFDLWGAGGGAVSDVIANQGNIAWIAAAPL